MSGSSIPYQLRPHKAVDRRLFIDLLTRYERWQALTEAAYISMGAYPLEDHKLVHRVLGLRKLIAFDSESEIVKRQYFNRPIDSCKCFCYTSGDLVANLDEVLAEAGYADASNLIVWLDYTTPAMIGEQIREFCTLLDKLKPSDIVRVTVNASASALYTPPRQKGVPAVPSETIRGYRLAELQERIGDFLPAGTDAGMMTDGLLPSVLSKAFGAAALEALPIAGDHTFAPLSIVRYADGQQMLSLTGVVVQRDRESEMREKIDLDSWRFASRDWNQIHPLTVPNLTIRERLLLERSIDTMSIPDIKKLMGFDYGSLEGGEKFLDDYRHYYRFYPNLLAVET